MSRLRSSSRCSTRLSRSSWPIGRRRLKRAPGWRSGVRARGGLILRAALARHDLGIGGRTVELLLAHGRLLATLVAVLVLAGQRVLELAHARAELAPEPGQALGPEDDEHDEQDDPQLEGADV